MLLLRTKHKISCFVLMHRQRFQNENGTAKPSRRLFLQKRAPPFLPDQVDILHGLFEGASGTQFAVRHIAGVELETAMPVFLPLSSSPPSQASPKFVEQCPMGGGGGCVLVGHQARGKKKKKGKGGSLKSEERKERRDSSPCQLTSFFLFSLFLPPPPSLPTRFR